MSGISYLVDEDNQKMAVVIDVRTLEAHPDEIEDLLDLIVAEARRNEPKKSWEEVKESLKAEGKL